MTMYAYVGTFAEQSGTAAIYVYRVDPETGALERAHVAGGLHSPTWVALHPNGRFLYTVERQGGGTIGGMETGAVTSFALDPASGGPTLLNRQSSQGVSPPYVSVHPSGGYAFAANYASGHVCALPIHDDGTLGAATSVHLHQGNGPNARRQEGPHAHFITPDPSGRYVVSCDLGIDKVMVYRFDPGAGGLVPNAVPYAQVPSGEGPRHLSFHPSGRFVYVINEIGCTVCAFAYDGERGTFTHLNTVSTLPEGVQPGYSTAQIVVHPNGRYVYGSNRGHDSIAIFGIDQESGRISPLGHEPARGRTPRNFNIDPSGRFLYACNQDSNTIVVFRIDEETGRLTATGDVVENPHPVCIIFRTEG